MKSLAVMLKNWKQYAGQLKIETYALYLAYKDARTPWYAKIVAASVVTYALSPFDLIPDFIPGLGYLDDLVLIPLGVMLALKLIPPSVLAECRLQAQQTMSQGSSVHRAAAMVIVFIWLLLAALAIAIIIRIIGS